MAQPDPRYDLQGALESLLPGIVVQRNLLDAGYAQYAANGFTPLTEQQATACLTAANALDLPDMMVTPMSNVRASDPTQAPYPATLPPPIPLDGTFAGQVGDLEPEIIGTLKRLPDSNPSPKMGLNGMSRNPRVVGG